METKIPKKIHYCWFGKNDKPQDFLTFLETWKKYCPDYEIIEWNEDNFDLSLCEYTKRAYDNKKWAFVSDYVRFAVLEKHGGIYMDTDVEVYKNLDIFLNDSCFLGFQDKKNLGGAVIGCEKNHPFISEVVEFYKNYDGYNYFVLPYLIMRILRKYGLKNDNKEQIVNNVHIYSSNFFYPFAYYQKPYEGMITNETYTVHWYTSSWVPALITGCIFPIIGFFKKFF